MITEVIQPAYVEIAGAWPRETVQPGEEPHSQLELMINAGWVIPVRSVAPKGK